MTDLEFAAQIAKFERVVRLTLTATDGVMTEAARSSSLTCGCAVPMDGAPGGGTSRRSPPARCPGWVQTAPSKRDPYRGSYDLRPLRARPS